MRAVILYHPRGRITALALTEALKEKGRDVEAFTPAQFNRWEYLLTPYFGLRRDRGAYVLIRWGSARQSPTQPHAVLNAGLGRVANKYQALQIMRDSGLVQVPPFSTNYLGFNGWQGVRLLGRKFSHMQGRDIRIVDVGGIGGPLDLDYYTVFIAARAEYRFHVFNGAVFLRSEKLYEGTSPASMLKNGGLAIRNRRNGWLLDTIRTEPPPGADTTARNAVGALGLDFGAVDLLHGLDGTLYVLEVNSAPAATNLTLVKYANRFSKFIRKEGLS
jgi:hypothetical protein